jgi:signal transduction histidine kinase
MSFISVKNQRLAALVFFALIAAVATVDLVSRRGLGVETEQMGDAVVISSIKAGSSAETSGIKVGDRLLAVNGRNIANQAVAKWVLNGISGARWAEFRTERSGAVFGEPVSTDRQFQPIFVVLNTLLGLVFLAVGMMVWWSGNRDPTIRSFFRLNSLAGIAILLYGHENTFHLSPLHEAYSAIWLFTYCLIPAALVEFLIRFVRQRRMGDHRPTLYRLLYVPVIVIFAGLIYSYHMAYGSDDPLWITRYDALFFVGFSVVLVAYFVMGILVLAYNYLRPVNQAEKDQVRWLLICMIIGLIPFFLLYKAPTLIGLKPFIPLWATFGLMLIVPIGWGMSVASFRMLKIEWVLSRTIIYAIAVGVILYLMLTGSLLSFDYFRSQDTVSLVVLILVGSIVIALAVSGLIRQIHHIIDRIYYHDWYNYRNALRGLMVELSGSIDEATIIHILTERLPSILRIEKSVVLIRWQDEDWRAPVQSTPMGSEVVELICGRAKDTGVPAIQHYRSESTDPDIRQYGYEIMIPLVHADSAVGIMLLGKKLSGAPFSIRDHFLLDTLSSTAGTALANLALTRKLLDNEKRAVAVDMAGGIAHEINNALSPLMGQAQLIERSVSKNDLGHDREVMTQRVGMIVDMCNRIKRIALNLSRISEPLHLEVTPISLNDILEETLQIMSEMAGRIKRFREDDPESLFQMERRLDPDLPSIMGDRQQLSQVFINLILNASDAMEQQGKGTLKVGTRYDPEQRSIVGYVEDTGSGIPSDLMDKIFQPYFSTKEKGKGTGLGLSIVRSIIEAHSGKIAIQSSEGRGTRVEFSIPISMG